MDATQLKTELRYIEHGDPSDYQETSNVDPGDFDWASQDATVLNFCADVFDMQIGGPVSVEDLFEMYSHHGWCDRDGLTTVGMNIFAQTTGRNP